MIYLTQSDEMAHVAFPDEHYNKQTHNNTQRWVYDVRKSRVNNNSFCERSRTHLTYTHANN